MTDKDLSLSLCVCAVYLCFFAWFSLLFEIRDILCYTFFLKKQTNKQMIRICGLWHLGGLQIQRLSIGHGHNMAFEMNLYIHVWLYLYLYAWMLFFPLHPYIYQRILGWCCDSAAAAAITSVERELFCVLSSTRTIQWTHGTLTCVLLSTIYSNICVSIYSTRMHVVVCVCLCAYVFVYILECTGIIVCVYAAQCLHLNGRMYGFFLC